LTGTFANVAGIVLGALIGVALKKRMPQKVTGPIMKALGAGIVIIGINGILIAMIKADPETGALTESGGLLLLISLVVGCIIGELIHIDGRISDLGKKMEAKFNADGLAKGFVTASLIFCVGALAVIGAIEDGLRGDPGVLLTKTLLDFTTSIVLAASLGIGVALSALPVFILQGGTSLLAGAVSPFITEQLLDMFCMVGYALVLIVGVNFIAETKIKVANLLPALIIPILYYFISPAILSMFHN